MGGSNKSLIDEIAADSRAQRQKQSVQFATSATMAPTAPITMILWTESRRESIYRGWTYRWTESSSRTGSSSARSRKARAELERRSSATVHAHPRPAGKDHRSGTPRRILATSSEEGCFRWTQSTMQPLLPEVLPGLGEETAIRLARAGVKVAVFDFESGSGPKGCFDHRRNRH